MLGRTAGKVIEQSSTDSRTATSSGRAQIVVDAGHAAPATHPSPNIGTRRTSGRIPSRLATRASKRGHHDAGDRGGRDHVHIGDGQSGLVEAARTAAQPSSTAFSMNRSLDSPKSLSVG